MWTALVTALAGSLLSERLRSNQALALSSADVRLEAARNTMTLILRQLAALPSDLAHRDQVQALLADSSGADIDHLPAAERDALLQARSQRPLARTVREQLDRLVDDFGIPLAVLIDRSGYAVIDSVADKDLKLALRAGNASDRGYFTEAMANGASTQFIVGRLSKIPGFYLAHRVDVEGRPVGVAVVKQEADSLSRLLGATEGSRVFVTDANGVVVIGNRNEEMFHRLPDAPAWSESMARAIYLDVPSPLAWRLTPTTVDGRSVTDVDIQGSSHLLVSAPLDEHGFTLWVMSPPSREAQTVVSGIAMALGFWVIGCGLLYAGWRRMQWLEASLRSRKELADVAAVLPLSVFRYLQPEGGGPGHFLFIGHGAESTLGLDERSLRDDPQAPWRLAGSDSGLPPTEPVEFRVWREGRDAWVLAHSTRLEEADGSAVYNGYWLDVSATRQAQARFEAMFEHSQSGHVLFDRKRGITRCNAAALSLFGALEAAQLLGRIPWFEPLSPAHQPDGRSSREAVLQTMRRHMATRDRVASNAWRFCRLDGTEFDSQVSVIAIDWEGEPQFCAVIEDVTLRNQADEAMRMARADAEAASQTKSSFLANMSHELRTPMNAIIGMTHLALEDGLPPRQRDYIEKAHGSARNLLQILNDILDVSKIEAGHLALEEIDFELESVIHETTDLLGLKAEEKGLELLFSPAPGLPDHLVGDPTRLRQVLVNLGSNAIKFTDAGEVTVGLEVLSEDEHGVTLHGWVRDTGVGMSADELSRIFQPFIQADSSTTRRFGGTGLGLAICSQLAERMGGRLWADSEPGGGSTFHFSARFGRAADRAEGARAWSATELKGRRALLADDNAAAREVLGRMLEDVGIVVDRAASGADALRKIDEAVEPYSWILLDWKMPGLDGVACARRILDRHPEARPCVLLVTAFARDDALRAANGLPLAGVLQKPVTPSTLCDLLMHAPINGMAPAAASRQGPSSWMGPSARHRLTGARILLVEDHPLNQQLALELLRRAGMVVSVANDGEEALRLLESDGPFDGVLMDCQMPVMDGYTATRRLRADRRWRDLPVIAMTASALAADRDKALASGMDAHITKPLDIEAMFQTMAQWIVPAAGAEPAVVDVKHTAWSPDAASSVIDTADGLARCGGNADLYRRLLRGFREASLEEAGSMPPAGAAAQRRVHNLKGLAGSIGAHALHAAAADLQGALAAADERASKVLADRVQSELASVLEEIDRLVSA